MRFRSLALALALSFGITGLVQATPKNATVKPAKSHKPKKYKPSKQHKQAKAGKTKPHKAKKHKPVNA